MTPWWKDESERPRAGQLAAMLQDADAFSRAILRDLEGERWMGPRLAIVNPLVWEIGHIAWFQERWLLRVRSGPRRERADVAASMIEGADALWDSSRVAHETRWDLPYPSPEAVLGYKRRVLEQVLERLAQDEPDDEGCHAHMLVLHHEDMHGEAMIYTRQTLAYPPPSLLPSLPPSPPPPCPPPSSGEDVTIEGGCVELGARPGEGFAFDNEKWAHPVRVEPFAIARLPVTNREFAAFVDEGGYGVRALWSQAGWDWREREGVECPAYWRRAGKGQWEVRLFDRHVPLAADHPVIHVNAHEAEAYCRWAGRRLPTEAEWELVASGGDVRRAGRHADRGTTRAGRARRRYPWGDTPPASDRAHLDARSLGTEPVQTLPRGDSATGVRQMIGNVWEWTSSAFAPYPGFAPDFYEDYSRPWFGPERRVLRGGAWATRGRLIRNTWRNFFSLDRRDIFVGFRTCAAR